MAEPQSDMTPGLLSGQLEGMSIPDLMWALCRRSVDGVLRVQRDGVRKTVYFERGNIVFAASSDPDDRLGELLLREGLIRLDHLEEALGRLGCGKRLGTLLVEAGHLTPDHLVRGVLSQVREIVLDLFVWEHGEYGFEPGPLPTREVITLDMRTAELLLQGIRRIRSFTRIRRSVGPARTVYQLRPNGRELLEGLSLTSGEEQLVARLADDAGPIESLCREVFLSNFEVYQALWALRVIGAVDVDERVGTVVDDAAVAGRFGAETLAPLLVRLCRAGETGVLFVSRGTAERTVHLRDGRVVFATSNDIDDGLIAYLLRRGVISLRDREETAKRLLSNKRVGTILREMGVIDDLDLRTMVREQLTEILHDTVAWPDGEYAFVPGELPTMEEITLDASVESLVAGGLRRVTSWSRVRDGIGGVRQRLELSPEFLTVLDRMSIGPAEWEVVTALKEPRSAIEICRETGLGDFQVSQILWALRVLGAVTFASELPRTADVAGDDVTLPAALALDDAVSDDAADGFDVPAGEAEPAPVETAEAFAEPEDVFAEPAAAIETDAPAASTGTTDEQSSEPPHVAVDAEPAGGEASPDEPSFAMDLEPSGDPEPEGYGAFEPEADTVAEPGAGSGWSLDEIVAEPVDDAPEWTDTMAASAEDVEPEADAACEPALDGIDDRLEPDATQVLSRGEVAAAIGGDVPSPDATQALDPELVRAVLAGSRPEDESAGFDEGTPDADEVAARDADVREEFDGSFETAADGSASAVESGSDEPADAWTPPTDLAEQIARFNARQRVLYRTLRAEVGAGAVNFVRSCCGKVAADTVDPFEGVELHPDGTWDAGALARAAQDHRLDDPSTEYDRLLALEFELLRIHIGEARAQALQEQMERASAQPTT